MMTRFKYYSLLAFLLLLGNTLPAQYLGGQADGAVMTALNLAGPCDWFNGGIADGAEMTLLPNPDPCGYYFGDSADGFEMTLLVNPDSCGFFEGSVSDGSAMTLRPSPVACPTFYGNTSDGFAMGEEFCLPLAVTSTGLNGRMEGPNAFLFWTTATEINNLGFILQRSENQLDWQEVAFLGGQTLSNSPIDYYHTDETKPLGVSYYRWEQIDLDGTKTLSNTVALVKTEAGGADFWVIYPNPLNSGDFLNYEVQTADTHAVLLQVVDVQGHVLYEKETFVQNGRLNGDLPTTGWSAGTYLFILQQGKQRGFRRFILF